MNGPESIAISPFVRRQTADSQFSHWTVSDAELLSRVAENFAKATPGYRDGVVLVPVPSDGFYSNTVQLKENDIILGIYKPRKAGEEPRRQTFVLGGQKMPAARVDVVLYRHDVLAEGNEQSCDLEWEIISVNAEAGDNGVPSPIKVGTLLANHFGESGGTATKMSPEALEDQLGASVAYWRDKGDAAPNPFIAMPAKEPSGYGWELEVVLAVENVNARAKDLQDAVLHYQKVLADRAIR